MKQLLFLSYLLFPALLFAQAKSPLEILTPDNNDSMKVVSPGCQYIDFDIYLVNDTYVVYENCTSRKVIYPDMASFRIPAYNEGNFFAADKNGIYFRGEQILTDTTGFTVIGRNRDFQNLEVLWKTKDNVYNNTTKIMVSDVASFQAVECINGYYFKDKNFIYYFDKKIEHSDGATVQNPATSLLMTKSMLTSMGQSLLITIKKPLPSITPYSKQKNMF